ncbi:MAG: MotA/TolQ/ExbB proton channel family protein [Methylococcales bacterium]|nr:MotA/TolQ/ExbB proton channel family protein [Methylococcales bacterium]
MKKILLTLLLLLPIQIVIAEEVLNLTDLLKKTQALQTTEGKINKEREAKFLADKTQQDALYKSAQAALATQVTSTNVLREQVEKNKNELAELQTLLHENSGDLTQLFTVAKQVAGDLTINLKTSLISAQFPQRNKRLNDIAHSEKIPTIDQLEALWIVLQQEMTESGKIVQFSNADSASGLDKVTRIGNFNAIAKGKYLHYVSETGKLATLSRQPDSDYLDMADDLESAQAGELVDVGIDPTRGVILSMLVQAPDSSERIKQGGVIGYIILIMGAIGFIYAVFRLVTLIGTAQKMEAQITHEKADDANPLGRIFIAAQKDDAASMENENLELLLDEAITREIPALERGLPMIKLLAAVAPLLGLLGTVTGMIATFQSISLFGTGDPKLMANGISQALVTTMLGLCIAIPLLFLHSIVAARSRTLIQILDEQTAGLLARRLEK